MVDGKAESQVRRRAASERLQEVAERIGGHQVAGPTWARAQELLEVARAEFGPKGKRAGNPNVTEAATSSSLPGRKPKTANT